jgi:hypothetical protein
MSAVKGDRVTMKDESEKLGYLTGEENEVSLAGLMLIAIQC